MKQLQLFYTLLFILIAGNCYAATGALQGNLGTAMHTQQFLKEVSQFNIIKEVPKTDSELLAQWEEEVKQFAKNRDQLEGKEAITTWLNLYERMWQIPRAIPTKDGTLKKDRRLNALITALPNPDHWKGLLKKTKGRKKDQTVPQYILMYITSFLNGKEKAMGAALEDMASGLETLPEIQRTQSRTTIEGLTDQLRTISGSTQERLDHFYSTLSKNPDYVELVKIIDLVAIAGEEKAASVLEDVLIRSNKSIQIDKGSATLSLAKAFALEHINDLKRAQWNLAHNVDALGLYEALDQRFPVDKSADGTKTVAKISGHYAYDDTLDRTIAKAYYMIGLIIAGQQERAKEVARDLGLTSEAAIHYQATLALRKAGYTREIYQFLTELLKEEPLSNMWEYYIPIAVEAGESASTIERLKEALSNENIGLDVKMKLTKFLYKAHLSLDQYDEAQKLIRSVSLDVKLMDSSDKQYAYLNLAARLAATEVHAGRLMNNKKWVDHGLKMYRRCLERRPSGEDARRDRYFSYLILGKLMMQSGKTKKAEKVIGQFVLDQLEQDPELTGSNDRWNLHEAGVTLLRLYHKEGRFDDILTFIDQYPYFTITDARNFINDGKSKKTNIAFIIANAFYQKGDKDTAVKIAKEILLFKKGHDPSYELITNVLEAQEALAFLDLQYKRDQFEERPLIFKAEIYLKQRRLNQAFSTIEQAIAIDPSDGEQGKDRRMRAYKVYGAIMAAMGNQKKSEFFKQVVTAIRASERADEYYANGMITRALEIYRESLNTFEDAYCIQSRLAIRLEGVGRYKEAQEHFIKAYTLMPDSFGRRESHCFGCELVFSNKRRQSIAQDVFSNLLQKDPDNPKIHYLMGYLRMEEGNVREARGLFKKATELDPLYINAWKKRKATMPSITISKEEKDEIIFNILKLVYIPVNFSVIF